MTADQRKKVKGGSKSSLSKTQGAVRSDLKGAAQSRKLVTGDRTFGVSIPAETSSTRAELNDAAPDYGSTAEFKEIRKRERLRWRDLATNKVFVWETFRLKYQLGLLLKEQSEELRKIFTPTFPVSAPGLQAAMNKIKAVRNQQLRGVLRRYAKYAALYNVVFVLRNAEPRFRVRGTGFWGGKLDVAVRNGRLEPRAGSSGEAPLSDDYESTQLSVPVSIQSLVDKRKARYVRVQDAAANSVVSQLVNCSYSPTEVTVIDVVSASRTRRLLMVGEDVALNSVSTELRSAITESQKAGGAGEQRGAPADVRTLHSRLSAIVRVQGTMASKAAQIVENENRERILRGETIGSQASRVATMQTHLTQLKRKLES